MSSINSNGSCKDYSTPSTTNTTATVSVTTPTPTATKDSVENEFKFILYSLKSCLSAADRFKRFLDLSLSHGNVMVQNVPVIKDHLIQIILNLLSSVNFKFSTLIDCNGLARRLSFNEMLNQMDRFGMDDYRHWTLIIKETKVNLEKFFSVNKAKYEDLVQFVHFTFDHIHKHNVLLDLSSFAVLFNTMAFTKRTDSLVPDALASKLDISPLSSIPGCVFSNNVSVIRAMNCTTPPGPPMTIYSGRSLNTHCRRLNWEALDDEEREEEARKQREQQQVQEEEEPADSSMRSISIRTDSDMSLMSIDYPQFDYQLVPITLPIIKLYHRPEEYNNLYKKFKKNKCIPFERSETEFLADPRLENRIVIIPRQIKKPVRTVNTNGTITVNLATSLDLNHNSYPSTPSPLSPTPSTPSPVSEPKNYPRPTKRARIIWDLD